MTLCKKCSALQRIFDHGAKEAGKDGNNIVILSETKNLRLAILY
jgi:hypothetical protein